MSALIPTEKASARRDVRVMTTENATSNRRGLRGRVKKDPYEYITCDLKRRASLKKRRTTLFETAKRLYHSCGSDSFLVMMDENGKTQIQSIGRLSGFENRRLRSISYTVSKHARHSRRIKNPTIKHAARICGKAPYTEPGIAYMSDAGKSSRKKKVGKKKKKKKKQ